MTTRVDRLLRRLERHGVRPGLEPTRALLGRLGDPHLQYPVVLVAGTNGKGSCAALLASALGAAGYRAGLYTSPHLEEVRERVRVDGRAIAATELEEAVSRVLETAPPEPTWFEAVTAAALLAFARAEVEIAVLEVGMGGRLDATNVTDPLVSVITSVALDHQDYLGSTLEAVAREKAGVLRPGRAGVVWVGDAEIRAALEEAAAALGTPLRRLPEEARWRRAGRSGAGPSQLELVTPRASYLLECQLPGAHQLDNLSLAAVAAEELFAAGLDRLDPGAVERGVRNCRWPGRLEEVELPDGRRILLDGAHNPAAAARLAAHLGTLDAPCDLLFGALEDKNADGMLGSLAPAVRRLVLTAPPSPRARAASTLAALVPKARPEVEEDLEKALKRALAGSEADLVVTGSLYLVGAVRQILRRRFGTPAPAAEIAVWERAPFSSASRRAESARRAPEPAGAPQPTGTRLDAPPGPRR